MSSKTKVKVHLTTVKFFDSKRNAVNETLHLGKMTVIEAKALVRSNNPSDTYINKLTKLEQFEVDTQSLLELRT